MSKKDKTDGMSFDEQKELEAKDAKKKLKAAEKAKPAKEKSEKKSGAKKSKKVRRWLKDFRGELKKIVWPDFKTVMKNTGIVIVTVTVIGAMVWIADFVLSLGVDFFKDLAEGVSITAEAPTTWDEEIPGGEDETTDPHFADGHTHADGEEDHATEPTTAAPTTAQ